MALAPLEAGNVAAVDILAVDRLVVDNLAGNLVADSHSSAGLEGRSPDFGRNSLLLDHSWLDKL